MTADRDFKRLVRGRARRTGESYVTSRRHLLRTNQEEFPLGTQLVPVTFERVYLAGRGDRQQHMMLLAEREGERHLAIFVGPAEARAIAMGAQRVAVERPMTHDMLKQAVDAFGYRPATSTFTAELVVERPPAEPVRFDCRPSDAIALAVRYEPPPEIVVPGPLLTGRSRTERRCP
jgi:bifunctional DNase/RNase